jgi:DNA sulfur modification protein DndD
MILIRLVVENFRPYEGRHEVEFAEPGEGNLTVIRGLNGTGKSSLFMALKWCFSGAAPVEQRRLACTPALNAAKVHDLVETRVEVTYGHEGRRFKAIRGFRTRVGERTEDDQPTFYVEPTSQFQLFEVSAVGEAKPVEAPFDEVRRAAPREALDYFFFDAERIGEFAEDGGGGAIRAAVREVLRFVELENAIRHVDSARQEFARKLRQVAGADSAALIQRREEENQRSTTLRGELEALDQQVASAKHVRDEYLARLKELASVRDLAEERSDLVARQTQLNSQRDESITAMAIGLPGLALSMSGAALSTAKQIVDTKRRRGEIPPKVKGQVLRDWLEAGKCICGRDLHPGSPEANAIHVELDKTMPSRIEEELVSLGGSIDLTRREADRQFEQERLALARLNQARELAMATADRLSEVDRELGNQPLEDVGAITAKIHRQDRDIEDWTTSKGEKATELTRSQQETERLSLEISKAELHNKQAIRLSTRHDLAARTVDALRDLKDRFENDVREQVEHEASQLFRELIWKADHYKAVTLSPDFRLEAVDKWGDAAFSTGGTSMGEARVLSIAFIVAMQVVARESLDTKSPAVIDSPFGNLSIEPMRRISERLPELVDQVVLFVTDTDWASCGDVLERQMGKFYDVAFDENRSVASLVGGSR